MKWTAPCIVTFFLSILATGSDAQQTVFGLLRKDEKLADQYYKEGNYSAALTLYQNAVRGNAASNDLFLRAGECYYKLKDYSNAARAFEAYIKNKPNLPWNDLYLYAEVQAALGNYDKAIALYRKYLVKNSDDEWIIKKIWRLSNIKFLYEDSSHYALRPLSVNTTSGELCATPYKSGIVFMSNRKVPELVDKVNEFNTPFYRIYFGSALADTATRRNGSSRYGKAYVFNKALTSRFNAGPVAFYDHFNKMVFVSSATEPGPGGVKHLQLYFAEYKDGDWNMTKPFPYNSTRYSLTDPAISPDGKTLFFSSDMDGGFGGRDLYRSTLVDNKWTRPVNLGEMVNTPYDEVFPFVHRNLSLYFSSNGHAGMGGLDIFKAAIKTDGFGEAENAGYPINSRGDDFGIVMDTLETHGYLSSNRAHGGFDDDLYEFDMDLQSYPLTITGIVRIKEHTWSDSSQLKTMPQVKVYAIDNLRNVTVHETTTDAHGNFSVVIPYFSKYVIRVVGDDGDENMAILEIPKHRKELSAHEIVMVRDLFKPTENQEVK